MVTCPQCHTPFDVVRMWTRKEVEKIEASGSTLDAVASEFLSDLLSDTKTAAIDEGGATHKELFEAAVGMLTMVAEELEPKDEIQAAKIKGAIRVLWECTKKA